jgi:hypothetical protein
MDRRHLVLAIALAASVATEYPGPEPMFSGEQTLAAASVPLDETRPIRTWVITTDVTLPPEAADHDFTSTTSVYASSTVEGFGSTDWLVVVLSECGSGGFADGPARGVGAGVEEAFVDCVPEQTCTRTFCVAIGNAADHPIEVQWDTSTRIESLAVVDHDVGPIDVPIDIAIEEIEP